jgi:hypothetical protein
MKYSLFEMLKAVQIKQKSPRKGGGDKEKPDMNPQKPVISEEHFLLAYRHPSTYTTGTYCKMWPTSNFAQVRTE